MIAASVEFLSGIQMLTKVRNFISGALVSIGSFLLAITWFSGLFLHLYTILFAYKVSGFIAAVIALVMPVLAQIYCVFVAWYKTGEFINWYSFYVFVYIGYFVFSMLVIALGSWVHKDKVV